MKTIPEIEILAVLYAAAQNDARFSDLSMDNDHRTGEVMGKFEGKDFVFRSVDLDMNY